MSAKVISWKDFEAQAPEKKWTVIHGKVYDVSSFMARHPGGFLIEQGIGRDATPLFEMSHLGSQRIRDQILPKLYVGDLGPATPDENPAGFYRWDSPFYSTLKERVVAHFKAKGTSHHDHPIGWAKALLSPLFFVLTWYWTLCLGIWWCWPLFGFCVAHCGMQSLHDATHGGLSASPTANRIVGYVGDLIGASSYVWKHDHVIGHHAFTNHDEDPNATTGVPVIRFHPQVPWWPHHRFQHFYTFLAYAAVSFKWPWVDIVSMLQGKYRDIVMYPTNTIDVAVFWIAKFNWIMSIYLLPIYWHGVGTWLSLMVPPTLLASYMFALQFAVTHISNECEFIHEDGKEQQRDWAALQVLTTTNYSSDTWLAGFYSGGLSFQIEHHLFPTVANPYYYEISPIVRKTCKEFDLPYNDHPSYLHALYHHYLHLKKLSVPCNHCPSFNATSECTANDHMVTLNVMASSDSCIQI